MNKWTDFNSRPRVGGDIDGVALAVDVCIISIHAPAWGATESNGW